MEPRTGISYRDYTFTLLAGVAKELPVSGDYYQIIEADDAVTLEFDQGVKIKRYQGMGGPAGYTRVRLTSDTDQTVVVSLGNTDGRPPYDGRATFQGSTVNVTERVANTITPIVDVPLGVAASAQLAALDATSLGLWVTVPLLDDAAALIVANTGIRVGDSTVAANKGVQMFPGDSKFFEGTAAIYAYNGTGVALSLSLASQRYV